MQYIIFPISPFIESLMIGQNYGRNIQTGIKTDKSSVICD